MAALWASSVCCVPLHTPMLLLFCPHRFPAKGENFKPQPKSWRLWFDICFQPPCIPAVARRIGCWQAAAGGWPVARRNSGAKHSTDSTGSRESEIFWDLPCSAPDCSCGDGHSVAAQAWWAPWCRYREPGRQARPAAATGDISTPEALSREFQTSSILLSFSREHAEALQRAAFGGGGMVASLDG